LIAALIGLVIVVALWPAGIWAVRFAKRQRGAAVLATSILLAFGMNFQITPPPPPQTEYVQRQAAKAPDDEPKDGPPS